MPKLKTLGGVGVADGKVVLQSMKTAMSLKWVKTARVAAY